MVSCALMEERKNIVMPQREKKEENGETQNAKVNVKATQLQPTLILDCSLLSGERKN